MQIEPEGDNFRMLTLNTESYPLVKCIRGALMWEYDVEKYRGIEITIEYTESKILTAENIAAISGNDNTNPDASQIIGTLTNVYEHGDTPGSLVVTSKDGQTIGFSWNFQIEMAEETLSLIGEKVIVIYSEEIELWTNENGFEYVNGPPVIGDEEESEYQMPEHGVELEEADMEGEEGPEFQLFTHAPNGDFSRSHDDTKVNYLTWDQTKWTAKLTGRVFTHFANGNSLNSTESEEIKYLTSNGDKWTAKIVDGRFLHAPEGNFNSAHADDSLFIEPGMVLHGP